MKAAYYFVILILTQVGFAFLDRKDVRAGEKQPAINDRILAKIAVQRDGDLLLLPVRIQGKEYAFILDCTFPWCLTPIAQKSAADYD